MNKTIYLLILVFTSLSCSNNDKEVAELMQEKIQSISGHEVVRDLLIENDNDAEQLARIFNCSVPTILRVKNKETYLTENANTEFKNLLTAVKVSGEDTLKENDPYYDSWNRSFLHWLGSIFWVVIAITIFSFILGAVTGFLGEAQGVGLLPIVLYGIIYLIIWGIGLVMPYDQPANLYLEQINPLFETLV
jgi:hypothetical protein